jgi:ppGpp synthetase/RelA/SpoT-type nucleotidyltranferase
MIEEEFTIDKDNSLDKRKELRSNEFGYLSVHYVVSLSPARAALGEYKNYASLRAEIQVRTVLQHAWAAVDHRLRYKSETDAPEHLRRRLFLLSGLLKWQIASSLNSYSARSDMGTK